MTVLWWVWLGRLPSCMGKCGEMCYKLLVSDDLSRQRCLSVRTLLTLLVLSFSAAGTWIIGCKSVLKRASNKVRPDCACILVPELLCLLFCFRLHLQALSLCNWTPFLRNVVMWDTLLCAVWCVLGQTETWTQLSEVLLLCPSIFLFSLDPSHLLTS